MRLNSCESSYRFKNFNLTVPVIPGTVNGIESTKSIATGFVFGSFAKNGMQKTCWGSRTMIDAKTGH